MSTFENQIDKIRNYFEDHKAERYPFENAALSEKDEYIKSLYFRILCAVIRYTGEPSEMQVLYVQRLIAGSHAENDFQGYMKMALDLDTNDIDEFISTFIEDDLKYYFCIDGTILLSVAETSDKNYELLAELIEMLGVNQAELTYLASAAKAIITQSTELFDETKALSPNSTKDLSLYHYVSGFYTGMIVDTPELCHIYSCSQQTLDISNYAVFKSKRVIIENISTTLTTLQQNLVFDGCAEVIIRKCSFNDSKNYIKFNNIGKVIVEDCEINGFSNRFAYFTHTNNIIIRKNRFINCGCTSERDVKGGILYSSIGKKIDNVIIENNEVLHCYVANAKYNYNYCASGILLHLNTDTSNVKVLNNHFSGCECRNNGYYTEAYITGRINSAVEEGNVCDGSVRKIFE